MAANSLPCGCIPGTETRCEEGRRLEDLAKEAYLACKDSDDGSLWVISSRASSRFFNHWKRQELEGKDA